MTRCSAHDNGYPSVHTCDDALTCAIDSLITGPDPRNIELEALNDLLDQVEDLCTASKSKLAQAVLTKIHSTRGGAR